MHGGMSTISKGQALITMVNSVVGLTELKGNYVDCRLLQLLLHESDVKKAIDFFCSKCRRHYLDTKFNLDGTLDTQAGLCVVHIM